MPVKLKCCHTEGFESGLSIWELDVGDWERASGIALDDAVMYTLMIDDEYGTVGTTRSPVHMQSVQFLEPLCCNGVILHAILEHPRQHQQEMEQVLMMTSACKSMF